MDQNLVHCFYIFIHYWILDSKDCG